MVQPVRPKRITAAGAHYPIVTSSSHQLLRSGKNRPSIGSGFFDQPRGVSLIAATEFWERFSYYGFTGLAALFMAANPATGGLGMEKGLTLTVFGLSVGMMFMAPSLGGWIADRQIGPFAAVVIGCIGLASANFLLAAAGTQYAHALGLELVLFYSGLAVMIAGAGMFKSNISSLLGQL